jgi:hypothetical protein
MRKLGTTGDCARNDEQRDHALGEMHDGDLSFNLGRERSERSAGPNLKRRAMGFVAVLAFTLGLPLTLAQPAQATTCAGQIPQGFVSPAVAFPLSYHLSRDIDGDPYDLEYVFTFSKPWQQGVDFLRWTGSAQMKQMANDHWHGTLGAKSCYGGGKFEVYADAGAVALSGGPDHWYRNLVVSTLKP